MNTSSERIVAPYDGEAEGADCDDGCGRAATRVIWHRKPDGDPDPAKPPPLYLCDHCKE